MIQVSDLRRQVSDHGKPDLEFPGNLMPEILIQLADGD